MCTFHVQLQVEADCILPYGIPSLGLVDNVVRSEQNRHTASNPEKVSPRCAGNFSQGNVHSQHMKGVVFLYPKGNLEDR